MNCDAKNSEGFTFSMSRTRVDNKHDSLHGSYCDNCSKWWT